jgi:cytochrome b subunit of formate dehydrogenase
MVEIRRVRAIAKLFALALTLGLLASATVASAARKPSQEECLACHADPTLTKDADDKPESLHIDAEHFKNSIHGGMFSCVDCHKGVKAEPHETSPAKVTCAQCHADEQAAYERSFHAKAIQSGERKAATCEDCHGDIHELLPTTDPKSSVSHANIPTTCGRCHGQKFVMEASGHSAQPFVSYQQSVHGRAVAAGKDGAAVCTDCHGAHEILAASDPKSSIFKFNVPETCGKCHQGVEKEFMQSIHGQALARGNGQTPVCTDCHGIHSIKAHIDPNSSVSALNVAQTTCARCHEGVRLSQEFDMQRHPVTTYLDSYHGLASRGGSQVVANCASCHGVHNILPSIDPRSTINKANLAKTCGVCHPGVNEKFALNKVHVDSRASADVGSIAVRWIRRFYLLVIFGVIGAMFLHNLLIWRAKALARRRTEGPSVVRMSPNQRWQHLLLLISFFVLVVTGFALKYPNSWLAEALGMGERLRSLTHRIAGVVMIATGIYHLFYIALSRSGRRLISDFTPEPKDAFDLLGTMRYYLGLSRIKPEAARFNYAEKAEYWALVWGIVLMATTGIMLWAKVWVGDLLARWLIDVATAIHFYEAVLATLAILVWHFYQVFFDPDVYPMNWAWWDGKMSRKHYREEHALDAEILATTETADPPVDHSEPEDQIGN